MENSPNVERHTQLAPRTELKAEPDTPSIVPPTFNYNLLLNIGAAISAATCVFTFTVAALAVASIITLSTAAFISELAVATVSGILAFGLFRKANENDAAVDANLGFNPTCA